MQSADKLLTENYVFLKSVVKIVTLIFVAIQIVALNFVSCFFFPFLLLKSCAISYQMISNVKCYFSNILFMQDGTKPCTKSYIITYFMSCKNCDT